MILSALRKLRRHWRLTILGVYLALMAQLVMMLHITPGLPPTVQSRQYEVGVASAAVLIDSQSSQSVDLGGGGKVKVDVAVLSARAKLLANLLVTRPLRDDIAMGSGLRPNRLITRLSSTTEPGAPPSPASDTTVDADDPDAGVLDLQTSETVPIITVNAQAPSEQTAARLAASTITTLRRYLTSVAEQNRVPDVRQLVMRPLGRPVSALSQRGPSEKRGAFVFVVMLACWCAGILAVSGLRRAWRQAAADEDAEERRGASSAPYGEHEASRAPLLLRVSEGSDHEPRPPPPPEATSRVA